MVGGLVGSVPVPTWANDGLAFAVDQVAGYGVELLEGQVERIDPGFIVHLAGGPVLRPRRVLVATELRDELPEIPGVRERWGRDVLHCPYCHGYEVRDQPIGVLGTGPGAVVLAPLLRQWSGDAVLFPHTLDLTGEEHERLAARGIHIACGVVQRLVVDGDRLRGGWSTADDVGEDAFLCHEGHCHGCFYHCATRRLHGEGW